MGMEVLLGSCSSNHTVIKDTTKIIRGEKADDSKAFDRSGMEAYGVSHVL
jgi:hypothetical protein